VKNSEWQQRTQAYWSKARAHVKKTSADPDNPDWVALALGDAELPAWAEYFQRTIGGQPFGMRQLDLGMIETFLVPAQLPEWFDRGYTPPSVIPPWPRRGRPP
jgi:hypothetical protein